LSYTTFHLDQLQMEAKTLSPNERTNVSVVITNTGKRAGTEVVQLYVTPPPSPVKRPDKQLAGFQRVELQPGEKKIITFELSYTELGFWYWKEEARQFVCQPGTAKILVGNSSANLLPAGELTLKASDETESGSDPLDCIAVKSRVG
jgi:beta-glucosidase